jgi:hypothetical protein
MQKKLEMTLRRSKACIQGAATHSASLIDVPFKVKVTSPPGPYCSNPSALVTLGHAFTPLHIEQFAAAFIGTLQQGIEACEKIWFVFSA